MSYENDSGLADGCLAGAPEACREFEERHHAVTVKILLARGASPTEANDLTRNLLSDCVVGAPGGSPLLCSYNGKCSLQSWLTTCATHRLIDLKRRAARFMGELAGAAGDSAADPFEAVPAPLESRSEAGLTALLRAALERALAACPAESRLMLRLVYIEGLTQREVGRMWHCHESKVSRKLGVAMQGIGAATIANVREEDPYLTLEWTDFLELCESSLEGLPW